MTSQNAMQGGLEVTTNKLFISHRFVEIGRVYPIPEGATGSIAVPGKTRGFADPTRAVIIFSNGVTTPADYKKYGIQPKPNYAKGVKVVVDGESGYSPSYRIVYTPSAEK